MVVVGAGLIGLVVAREAVSRGASVRVVEPVAPARGASWAAAGMLSPLGEAQAPGPFLDLAVQSLGLFPGFVASLREESGIDAGLRRLGKLLVALSDDEERELRARREWQTAEGFDVGWLGPDELRGEAPGVAEGARGAIVLDGEALVRPRDLGRAARVAAERAGVRILTGHGARGVIVTDGRVAGVRLRGGGVVRADRVVVAAGAWSGGLEGLPRPLPIRPVRGQMISLETPGPASSHMVSGAGAYLLPRGTEGDWRLWVGATMEEAGFDGGTTRSGRERLHASAARLFPALADAPVAEHWAGLRPATPDDLPVVGADPEVEGLVYATGHFRNGVLLAPVTARLVGRVLEGETPAELRPFRPERFGDDIAP